MASVAYPLPDPDTRRALRDAIVAWFLASRRSFPWREDPSPYRVWVSEIMAQQTRLDVVLPYFERFVERFPSVQSLAEAPLDDVLARWSGLGYYARARNLHASARLVVERHGGVVPRDPRELLALPGVGEYTAAAIASIAWGVPVPLLDGNVIRVLSRLFDVEGDVSRAPVRRHLWALSGALVPPAEPRALNEGLMELGALVCTPSSPGCGTCPVAARCLALGRGTVMERPVKGRAAPPVVVDVVAALFRRAGRVLLVQNDGAGLFGGLWQLPQHPPRPERTPEQVPAAVALAAGLGAPVDLGGRVGAFEHVLSHRRLRIAVHGATLDGEPQVASPWVAHRWVTAAELTGLGVASMTRKALAAAVDQSTPEEAGSVDA